MIINKHGSFYIRNGWPTKIINSVNDNDHVFSPNNEIYAVDNLGVGRVMVKAMRYWAQALGLCFERHDQQGVASELTELGEIIRNADLYFEYTDTLWLLHRNLSRNIDNATAWYWAFNIYNKNIFTKKDFVDSFHAYLTNNGLSYDKKNISKEFDCFKNTYISTDNFDIKKIINEDTTPFFSPLHLISYADNNTFVLNSPRAKDISVEIFVYCLFKDNEQYFNNNKQLSVETLLEEPGQAGRYFNLTFSSLLELLQRAENKSYLTLYNNFGSRYIELNEIDFNNILVPYFNHLGE